MESFTAMEASLLASEKIVREAILEMADTLCRINGGLPENLAEDVRAFKEGNLEYEKQWELFRCLESEIGRLQV